MKELNSAHVRGIFYKFGGGEVGAERTRFWSALKKLSRLRSALRRKERGVAKMRRRAQVLSCRRCDAPAGELCRNASGPLGSYVHPIRLMDTYRLRAEARARVEEQGT